MLWDFVCSLTFVLFFRVLCKFFAHGACLKGEHCEFSHDWKDPANNVKYSLLACFLTGCLVIILYDSSFWLVVCHVLTGVYFLSKRNLCIW